MTTKQMPAINLDALKAVLTADEFEIARGIVNPRTGALRASKPTIRRDGAPKVHPWSNQQYRENNLADAKTAYVWRMVAFAISPVPQHQCMPMTADFDLPYENGDQRRALCKVLDELADKVVKSVPVKEWHGVRRWGRAYYGSVAGFTDPLDDLLNGGR